MDSSTCLRVVKVATLHYHNRLGSFNSNSSIPITKTKTTMMGNIIKEIFSNKNMIDANKVNAHSKIHTLKFLRPKVSAPTITVSTMRRTIKLRAQVYTTKLSIIINSAISTTLGKTMFSPEDHQQNSYQNSHYLQLQVPAGTLTLADAELK